MDRRTKKKSRQPRDSGDGCDQLLSMDHKKVIQHSQGLKLLMSRVGAHKRKVTFQEAERPSGVTYPTYEKEAWIQVPKETECNAVARKYKRLKDRLPKETECNAVGRKYERLKDRLPVLRKEFAEMAKTGPNLKRREEELEEEYEECVKEYEEAATRVQELREIERQQQQEHEAKKKAKKMQRESQTPMSGEERFSTLGIFDL